MEGGEYDRRGSTGVLLTHDLSKPSGSGRCCVGRVWAIFGGIVIALLFGSVCVYVTNLSRNLDPHITPRAETDHLASNSDHLASQVVQKALQDSTSDDTVDLILKVLQNINPTAINPNAVSNTNTLAHTLAHTHIYTKHTPNIHKHTHIDKDAVSVR